MIVGALDLWTNSMPALWDGARYLDMAQNGVIGNERLVAPFAYRPGMPLLVRLVTEVTPLDAVAAFAWVGRFMAVAFLVASFLLARCFLDGPGKALVPVVFVGLSAMHVKFPLFTTLVDVAAYPIVVLAVWALVRQRLGLSLALSTVGLFFKEFAAIPLLLGLVALAVRARRERSGRDAALFAVAAVLASAAVLVPRLGLPIVASDQGLDPLRPDFLERLALAPLDGKRDLNLALALLGYWLPVVLLLTRERWRAVRTRLASLEGFVGGYLALDFLLALYGGSNLNVFVSYAVPVQILVLAALVHAGVPRAEWGLALACTFLFHRAAWPIPLPEPRLDAYIDFYGCYGRRVNASTGYRAAEIACYLLASVGLRAVLARRTRKEDEPDAGSGEPGNPQRAGSGEHPTSSERSMDPRPAGPPPR